MVSSLGTYVDGRWDLTLDEAYAMVTGGGYQNLAVLDVREKSMYDLGHIYGAIWIPHDQLEARLAEVLEHKNQEILIYENCGCTDAHKVSIIACGILVANGFTKVYRIAGPWPDWGARLPLRNMIGKLMRVIRSMFCETLFSWISSSVGINRLCEYDPISACLRLIQTQRAVDRCSLI